MKRLNKKVIFLLVSVVFFVVIGSIMMFSDFTKTTDANGNAVQTMDGRYRYEHEVVYETFDKLGEEGRAAYLKMHILDYFFLVSYAMLMAAVTMFFVPENKKWIAVVFPAIPAFFDFLENTLIEVLSAKYPMVSTFGAKVTAVLTTVKWTTGVLWFVVLLTLIGIFVAKKFSAKNKQKQA